MIRREKQLSALSTEKSGYNGVGNNGTPSVLPTHNHHLHHQSHRNAPFRKLLSHPKGFKGRGGSSTNIPPFLLKSTDPEKCNSQMKAHCTKGWRVWLVVGVFSLLVMTNWKAAKFGMFLFQTQVVEHYLIAQFYPRPTSLEPADFTFPSVEERVEYYMDRWYSGNVSFSAQDLCEQIFFYKMGEDVTGKPYIFDKSLLAKVRRVSLKFYPGNALDYMFKHAPRPDFRMILQFGDTRKAKVAFPIMTKSRSAQRVLKENETPPMVGYLNVERHYGDVDYVRTYVPWEKKKNTLIFRGVSTGNAFSRRIELVKKYASYNRDDIDVGFTHLNPRHIGDSEAESFIRDRLTHQQMLQYKYLLVLEGNDVSTGLKWMLYSDSVVFMHPATSVSWAMEEKLVPYVHFVPLQDDLSDLEEKLIWAREHDDECRRISQQATKYMEDLYVSPKAKRDNDLVLKGIVDRYEELYGAKLSKCPKP